MIPYLDLKTQYETLRPEIQTAINGVLDKQQYILGPAVVEFEKAFAAYCRTREGIALNTGTSALHLALLAADIGPGDEVITTAATFVATIAAIRYAGARPVLVDIDRETCTIDVDRIEAAITARTRAKIPVHLYGQMADMDPIMEIARRRGLVVIEDACQAHGAEYRGRRAGSIGEMGCFSFYPGKNLGAYGEGGAVVTNNSEYARKIRMLRDWGAEERYHHVLKGYNYRMDGIQGAVLGVKLRYLEDWTEKRRANAALYTQILAEAGVSYPAVREDSRHVFHIYAIRVADRATMQKELTARGIQTGIHYPIPVHLLGAHADLGYQPGDFPEAEALANEELSLPMFAELTREQIVEVCTAVCELSGQPSFAGAAR
jgi:dTDP-4-amino-4,6-dideoxygalactose transaminase